jgi:hypothetical protein
MRRIPGLLALGLVLLAGATALAHRSAAGVFGDHWAALAATVLWRTPMLSGMRLPVRLEFPEVVRNVTEPRNVLADSVVERRVIDAGKGGGWAGSVCSSSACRQPSPTCWCGRPC